MQNGAKGQKNETKVTKKAKQNSLFQSAKPLSGLTLLYKSESRKRPEKGILVLFFGPLTPFSDFGLVFRSPVRTYFGGRFWSCFLAPC